MLENPFLGPAGAIAHHAETEVRSAAAIAEIQVRPRFSLRGHFMEEIPGLPLHTTFLFRA